jgi:8-oxo-dGTP diphosphatase
MAISSCAQKQVCSAQQNRKPKSQMPEIEEANAASVAMIAEGRVLLIQRARAPYLNLWTLPGGRREPGESIEVCAQREIGEELGMTVTGLVPVSVETFGSAREWRLAVFASPEFAGEPKPSDEVQDWRWCRLDELRRLKTTARLEAIVTEGFRLLGQVPV